MDGSASTADDGRPDTEAEADFFQKEIWARLGAAPTVDAFAGAWLDLQCRQLGEVRAAAVLMTAPGSEQMSPVAIRPADAALSPGLVVAAERAAAERRGVLRPRRNGDPGGDACALPVIVDGALRGVVALELPQRARIDVRRVMRQLQWGAGWLEVLVRRKHPGEREQLVGVLDLVACTLERPKFQAAATALVTELAQLLGCSRVSLGLLSGAHARVRAISNSATFARKSGTLRAIASAMDEAVEQQAVVRYPASDGGPVLATRAHAELARAAGLQSTVTAPLPLEGRCIGALTLERKDGTFGEKEIALVEHLALLVAPALEAKRLNDRWLPRKAWDSGAGALRGVFGPRRLALKLTVLAAVALLAFLSLATGPFRITADASLEGTVRRVVTSPMEGFVDEALVRAGDVVEAGAPMARLDADELRLEQVRLLSEKAQLAQKYQAAFAAHERAEARIIRAQIEGIDARLTLVDEQLRRTLISAPFAGLVISGDLTQSLGSPVTRGEVLFEVAPLDRYRVIAQVDERDVTFVEVGQPARLVLSAMPDEAFAFTVEALTPVASTLEGRNRFRVEGLLAETDPRMRPGMEGVAKFEAGERRLIWIWTHRFWWWLRLESWRWWPHA